MRPITVLDVAENEKVYPRKTPNGKKVKNDKLGGFLFGSSAAIHVLGEDEDGWTLIEGIDYYNRVIRGYVRTKIIKTVTPNDHYGIIVDKLTQRLYMFIDGKLWSSCLVSTGKPNNEQPYNETAAGEYLVMSWVGVLDSDGMKCDMALRYNGGDMLHQVPYTLGSDGTTQRFERFEARLGTKASHGCIRIERTPNADGLCAQWLWDNLKKFTKVVIWDDKGRAKEYPDENALVYYNPQGGQYFHAVADCSAVKSKFLPLTGITYGELEGVEFNTLTPCGSCKPMNKISVIAEENFANKAITKEEYLAKLKPAAYPSDSLELYYNPNGGKYYHSTATCSNVKKRYLPLSPFTYGELDSGAFAKLTPCKNCNPVPRKADIDAENAAMGFTQQAIDTANEVPATEGTQESSISITILD